MQQADGGFASWGTASAESAAQVITALSTIEIDCDSDSRFVKNGCSAYDALLSYYVAGGGFKSAYTNAVNTYTTCQAFYSMAAYNRFKANEAPLYDMSDVDIVKTENNNEDNTANENNKPNGATDNENNNNNSSVPSDDTTTSPQTANNSNIIFPIILMLASIVSISVITLKKRKTV